MTDKKTVYSASLYKHSDLTEQIIGAFYDVYYALGYGFLENIYLTLRDVMLSEAKHLYDCPRDPSLRSG